jgi:hypothetical protein
MGLRNLFQRKASAVAHSSPSHLAEAAQTRFSSADEAEDLRAAWADLTEAARQSQLVKLSACTRNGRSWTEDPAAVRAIAAILRDYPPHGQQTT